MDSGSALVVLFHSVFDLLVFPATAWKTTFANLLLPWSPIYKNPHVCLYLFSCSNHNYAGSAHTCMPHQPCLFVDGWYMLSVFTQYFLAMLKKTSDLIFFFRTFPELSIFENPAAKLQAYFTLLNRWNQNRQMPLCFSATLHLQLKAEASAWPWSGKDHTYSLLSKMWEPL